MKLCLKVKVKTEWCLCRNCHKCLCRCLICLCLKCLVKCRCLCHNYHSNSINFNKCLLHNQTQIFRSHLSNQINFNRSQLIIFNHQWTFHSNIRWIWANLSLLFQKIFNKTAMSNQKKKRRKKILLIWWINLKKIQLMKKKKENNIIILKIINMIKMISQFKSKLKICCKIYNVIPTQFKIYFLNYKTFHKFNKHLKHKIWAWFKVL